MTRTPTDLHPDDLAARDRLAVQLRALRVDAGLTQKQLGERLGVTKDNVSMAELAREWRVASVQQRARALGYRLTLTIEGLTVPDDGDLLAAVYAAQRPTDPAAADRLLLRTVVNDLARIRRHRMAAEFMGRLMRRSESSVFLFERQPDGVLLVTAQRFTRALGGVLVPDLAPVEELAVAA